MAHKPSNKLNKQDVGDHLMSLLESDRMQEREQKLKQEIAQLQNKAQKLKERRDNLKNDLKRNININKNDNRGQLHPIKVPLCPLYSNYIMRNNNLDGALQKKIFFIIFIILNKLFSYPTT